MEAVNILIIGNPKEFLPNGVASILRSEACTVDIIAPRSGTTLKTLNQYNVCIIFISSAESIKHFIGSRSLFNKADNLRLCLVGSKDDLIEVTRFVSPDNVDCSILRPVDAKSIAAIVINMINGKVGRRIAGGKSILFLSMDQRLSARMRKILARNYHFFAVPTIAMAKAVLSKTDIDLIILDFRAYENMNTTFTMTDIKGKDGEDIPLIAFVEREDIVEIAKASLLNPVDYLFRTMTVSKLRKVIRNYFLTGRINDKYTKIPYVDKTDS